MFWPSPLGPGVTAVNARLERIAEKCAPSPLPPGPGPRPHPDQGMCSPIHAAAAADDAPPPGLWKGQSVLSSDCDVVTAAWLMMVGSE